MGQGVCWGKSDDGKLVEERLAVTVFENRVLLTWVKAPAFLESGAWLVRARLVHFGARASSGKVCEWRLTPPNINAVN